MNVCMRRDIPAYTGVLEVIEDAHYGLHSMCEVKIFHRRRGTELSSSIHNFRVQCLGLYCHQVHQPGRTGSIADAIE